MMKARAREVDRFLDPPQPAPRPMPALVPPMVASSTTDWVAPVVAVAAVGVGAVAFAALLGALLSGGSKPRQRR